MALFFHNFLEQAEVCFEIAICELYWLAVVKRNFHPSTRFQGAFKLLGFASGDHYDPMPGWGWILQEILSIRADTCARESTIAAASARSSSSGSSRRRLARDRRSAALISEYRAIMRRDSCSSRLPSV